MTKYNLAGRSKADEILSAMEGQGKEFTLFSLIEQFGECISGDVHVIDHTDRFESDLGEQKWMVYHAHGYCFESSKVAEIDDEGEFIRWDFQFYSEWDNFGKCDVSKAIELMTKAMKT